MKLILSLFTVSLSLFHPVSSQEVPNVKKHQFGLALGLNTSYAFSDFDDTWESSGVNMVYISEEKDIYLNPGLSADLRYAYTFPAHKSLSLESGVYGFWTSYLYGRVLNGYNYMYGRATLVNMRLPVQLGYSFGRKNQFKARAGVSTGYNVYQSYWNTDTDVFDERLYKNEYGKLNFGVSGDIAYHLNLVHDTLFFELASSLIKYGQVNALHLEFKTGILF